MVSCKPLAYVELRWDSNLVPGVLDLCISWMESQYLTSTFWGNIMHFIQKSNSILFRLYTSRLFIYDSHQFDSQSLKALFYTLGLLIFCDLTHLYMIWRRYRFTNSVLPNSCLSTLFFKFFCLLEAHIYCHLYAQYWTWFFKLIIFYIFLLNLR